MNDFIRPAPTAAENHITGHNLADGWYVALPSTALGRTPRRVDLFDRTYVAWRTADRTPSVLAATCPHMGAALFDGQVRGDTLECPFHNWRFAADGSCTKVPNRHQPPAAAATASLQVRERSGYLWVWYGSTEPTVEPPHVPELDGDRRRGSTRFRLADVSRATVRRILENTYDPEHLVALHGLTVDGAVEMALSSVRTDTTDVQVRLDVQLSWPAYSGILGTMSSMLGLNAERFELRVEGWATCQRIEYYADGKRVYAMVLATTPVDPEKTVQHINASIDAHGRGPARLLRALMHRIEVTVAARQDIPIFDSLPPGDRHGIYVPGDRGVKEFRRFYQQWVKATDGQR